MFKRIVEAHQEETFTGLESARAFAASAEKSAIRYRAFMNRLKTLEIQGKYLDVSAGAGNLAVRIAQSIPNVEITALEISTDMITVGEELVHSKGFCDRINFIRGDVADPAVLHKLGRYDLIYSSYALHHWENPRDVINKLMDKLKDGGVLYLYDLRRVWWLYWVPKDNGFFKSIRAAYLGFEIKEMLSGLEIGRFAIKNEFPFMQSIIIRK